MLPQDNVYSQALLGSDDEYRDRGWTIRVGGCRMLTSGVLEIALVFPGAESDDWDTAWDRAGLPGPNPTLEVAAQRVEFAGHRIVPSFLTEAMWAGERETWAYRPD